MTKTYVRLRRFDGGDAKVGMATTDLTDAMRVEEIMDDLYDEIHVFENGKAVDAYSWRDDVNGWVDLKGRLLSVRDDGIYSQVRGLRIGDKFDLAGETVQVMELVNIEKVVRIRIQDDSGTYQGFIQLKADYEFELISRA